MRITLESLNLDNRTFEAARKQIDSLNDRIDELEKKHALEIADLESRLRKEGHVYIFERDGLIKIGTSLQLVTRLRYHNKAAGTFTLLSVELGGRGREKELLKRFQHLAVTPGVELHLDDGTIAAYAASVPTYPPDGEWMRKAFARHGYPTPPME